MKTLTMALFLLLPCAPLAAQGQARSSAGAEKDPVRLKALRDSAKPVIQLARKHSGDLAALKRAHAAARKQLRAQFSGNGQDSEKGRKALSSLGKLQRDEWRKAVETRRTERIKLEKKNPAAAKAFRELVSLNVPLEEPAN
ncbi:MAG: hypothetical protein A2049_04495 [Elusimicrobia bacterium GWA2_62_23]|nr:MAG: hypothetical protein A2049_04495 [Elusimicrobia bacterium GWA2_62_23]